MQTKDDEMILLHKRLLEISEKECNEIAGNNLDLDRREEYSSLKEDIIKRLEMLNNNLYYGSGSEIKNIIKRILAINEKNISDILNLQDKIMSEMSTLQTGKKASLAYISNQYPHL
ncbi:MAG: hypothetical protein ACE5EA_07310 [Nitrospirota bacterium]